MQPTNSPHGSEIQPIDNNFTTVTYIQVFALTLGLK